MKATILLLLAGSISAIQIKQTNKWVELPNCPAKLAKTDVALADDLHNATFASCKIKTTPAPKDIPVGVHIYSPPQVPLFAIKEHEHQVTHHPEGNTAPSGPKYALVGRGNKWVELPVCTGAKDEEVLDEDTANASSASCKIDPESTFGKAHLIKVAAAEKKADAAAAKAAAAKAAAAKTAGAGTAKPAAAKPADAAAKPAAAAAAKPAAEATAKPAAEAAAKPAAK
jgi:hypothetical protein